MNELDRIMTEDQAPLVIEHGRKDVSNGGYFTPFARLVVQPALRTSGLLTALPEREVKSLLLLLTFLTPNGRINPTTSQIAEAFHLPEFVVRSRLGKLTAFRWQGERIVRHTQGESGRDEYRVSRSVLAEREATGQNPAEVVPIGQVSSYSSREAVIAHSRAAYGRPRAEVEEDIARRLGVAGDREMDDTITEEPEAAEARRHMLRLGVSATQIDRLLEGHPLSDIQDQLTWLPDRAARSPARYLVRAITERYAPPPRIRLERAIAAVEEAGKTEGGK